MNQPLAAKPAPIASPDLQSTVMALIADDMAALDRCISERLDSDVPLIRQIAEYLIYSGGKRIRPILLILSARACHYSGDRHDLLAAVIEFIHTATLLHDDVVDESALRRGQKTAHSVWGNAASVLVGDFLYSRAFQMMVDIDSMKVMQVLSSATNTIAEGEVLQLLNLGDPEVSEERYMRVIENKTAKLFEAACQLGAILADQPRDVELALKRFGNSLGCAFQIADDILDYDADAITLGKNIGDDLLEGKPTLPLIYAREMGSAADRALLDTTILGAAGTERRIPDPETLKQVVSIIHSSGALDRARARAADIAQFANDSLAGLPDNVYRQSLEQLCLYAVSRRR